MLGQQTDAGSEPEGSLQSERPFSDKFSVLKKFNPKKSKLKENEITVHRTVDKLPWFTFRNLPDE